MLHAIMAPGGGRRDMRTSRRSSFGRNVGLRLAQRAQRRTMRHLRIMMLDGALFPVRLLLVLVEDLTFERLACARLCDPRLCGLKLMFVQMQPSAPRAQRPARPARGIVYRNR